MSNSKDLPGGLREGLQVTTPPSSPKPSQPAPRHFDPLDQTGLRDALRDPMTDAILKDPLAYPPDVRTITGEKAKAASVPDGEVPEK